LLLNKALKGEQREKGLYVNRGGEMSSYLCVCACVCACVRVRVCCVRVPVCVCVRASVFF